MPSSVARTVTTPIEQQINGTKGMIYYSSDSTSNGVSNIVATFDVGFSQDMAAVDIQNRVQTAQAQLPPEVKQYGVTIKKSSTDMVCVVNLISPDGRYDATFLDNYGQIHVADVLKRINGISDATVLGRKYAMRIWIDPDRLANMKIAPTEVIVAVQQENVQAAAGKIGSRPVPTGQDFELPITVKGRLEKASEFEEIVVRRNDDGSIVRLKDVARVELSSENYETASYIDGKPAGGILIYQYADANALGHHRECPRRDGPGQKEFSRKGSTTRSSTTRPSMWTRTSARSSTRCRVVRAGDDRRVRLPPGLPGHDHPDAGDPGLAGRHLRDDGRVRLLDQLVDALRAGPGDRPGGR